MGFQFSCPPYSADRKGRRKTQVFGEKKEFFELGFSISFSSQFSKQKLDKNTSTELGFLHLTCPLLLQMKKKEKPQNPSMKVSTYSCMSERDKKRKYLSGNLRRIWFGLNRLLEALDIFLDVFALVLVLEAKGLILDHLLLLCHV